MIRTAAVLIASQNYADYSKIFLSPSVGLMVRTGLWIELEVVVGFIVGLGLGSLLGQRTVAVILMIVLEIVLTPILSRANIPHLINLQRSVVGLASPIWNHRVSGSSSEAAEGPTAVTAPPSWFRSRGQPQSWSSAPGWSAGPPSGRGEWSSGTHEGAPTGLDRHPFANHGPRFPGTACRPTSHRP